MRRLPAFLVLAALAHPARAAHAQSASVVLNEIFYDAAGTDGGFQFVELYNREDHAVALLGYRLEAGDGAGPERWRIVWTGQPDDVIPPHGRFVLGEGRVIPTPDRTLPVDLENGPDAVRLTAPDGARDVVGYGALTYASYFEGRPAEDVASGCSLARMPDGRDTDDNAADFVALTPATPGAANRPERDVALAHAGLSAVRLEPGDAFTLSATLANLGAGPLAADEIELLLWAAPRPPEGGTTFGQGDEPPAPDSLVARLDRPADLDPGDSLKVALSFTPPGPGAWDVSLAARTLDDGAPGNDRVFARLQVGPGALIVNEVASAPAGGPEWVELRNVTTDLVVLSGWMLEDATGRRGVVQSPGTTDAAYLVLPDSLVVLTADPEALRARHPALPASRVAACVPWPALNNAGSTGAPADHVVIRTPSGRASDAVDLPGDDPPDATLERRSAQGPSRAPATWGVSAESGGTPGRANSIDAGAFVPGVELAALGGGARPLAGESALLRYRTGLERATVTLGVYDLRGRLVKRLLDHADGPGQAGVAWDGRAAGGDAAPPGLYVAGLEARDPAGTGRVARARTWVVVR